MLRYAPQSLPPGGARSTTPEHPAAPQQSVSHKPAQLQAQAQYRHSSPPHKTHPSILLGQHIRRERGMQGVRAYTSRIREFLTALEYEELCRSMGVPAEAQKQSPPEQPPPPPPQQAVNTAQQMQMMQMLSQLMMGQGGANNANPMSSLLGGAAGAQAGGGLNPALLMQLLSGTQGNGSNAGGLNPMLIAQLLSSLGGIK